MPSEFSPHTTPTTTTDEQTSHVSEDIRDQDFTLEVDQDDASSGTTTQVPRGQQMIAIERAIYQEQARQSSCLSGSADNQAQEGILPEGSGVHDEERQELRERIRRNNDDWIEHEHQWMEHWRPITERARREERSLIQGRMRHRRISAIVETRRAWEALARREEYLRSVISAHYRMLGRVDILDRNWMSHRQMQDYSAEEIDSIRRNIWEMIDRDTGEIDLIMSWERFNDVVQNYDYRVTEGEDEVAEGE
jgi:hypothetical protein